jgi:MarR family transcriptional regulator for hemolysin
MAPGDESLSLLIGRVAKQLSRAFDDVLVAAGGSSPTWQVLRALSTGDHRTQAELAAAIGVRQPTLTHHLDALERAGLVTREREAGNRRVQRVTVTESGEALFLRLRRAAASFDGRLRAGLDDGDVAELRQLLAQLTENARPD